jgi:hypothetical protein
MTNKTFADFGIDVAGLSGVEVTTTCPQCSHARKKSNERCLSVNTVECVWFCHHCGWKGALHNTDRNGTRNGAQRQLQQYVRPNYQPPMEIDARLMEYVAARGIDVDVVRQKCIGLVMEYMPQVEKTILCIAFPYYRRGYVVNVKYRGLETKCFKQVAGAEKILYNLDALEGQTEAVFVEGEFDVLALIQAGILNVVSVPDGAPPAGSKPSDRKFEYLVNCAKELAPLRKIILAVDNDAPGKTLAAELARRLGPERCWFVTWPDGCKDANDVLCKHGAAVLRACIEAAQPWPVEDGANDTQRDEKSAPCTLTDMSDLVEQPVQWLWPGRIPLGKLTVLDGDPGLGKSLITLDLAARVSTGRAMPDGGSEHLHNPRGVILLSAEDDAVDTIRPRLRVAGADLTRVAIPSEVPDGDGTTRAPHIGDIDALRYAIHKKDAALVVIDPLMAYLPEERNSHHDQDIRRALAPLCALAAETGAAIVVVRHLNKTSQGNPLYRGGGSIGIIGAARAGLLVAVDPAEAERRVLASTKANLAPAAVSLSYRVIEARPGVAAIEWCGQSDHTAAALLAAASDPAETATERGEAAAWLKAMLADGPVSAKTLRKEAEDAGYSWRTVQRTQDPLGIIATKSGFHGGWEWRLPVKAAPTEERHVNRVASFAETVPQTPSKSLKNAEERHHTEERHIIKGRQGGVLRRDPPTPPEKPASPHEKTGAFSPGRAVTYWGSDGKLRDGIVASTDGSYVRLVSGASIPVQAIKSVSDRSALEAASSPEADQTTRSEGEEDFFEVEL